MENFSLIGAYVGVLWWILRCVQNEEKNKEINFKTNFWPSVSWKCLQQFSVNLVCRLAYLAGTSVTHFVPIG